jgi:hypothetical protein
MSDFLRGMRLGMAKARLGKVALAVSLGNAVPLVPCTWPYG